MGENPGNSWVITPQGDAAGDGQVVSPGTLVSEATGPDRLSGHSPLLAAWMSPNRTMMVLTITAIVFRVVASMSMTVLRVVGEAFFRHHLTFRVD